MLQAQVEALEAQREADRQRVEALEAQREAEQRQMAEVLWYMQSLGQHMGLGPPPTLFATPTPPPPQATIPVSMSMSMNV
jgi:septal ring factor EnvC (AmiA/AmiB activator)